MRPSNVHIPDAVKFPYYAGLYLSDQRKLYYNKLLKKLLYGEYHCEEVDTCYCGSNNLEILSREDRFGLPFGTKICRTCGLISLSPRLCEDSLGNFYDEIYWGLILGGRSVSELETPETGAGCNIFDFIKGHMNCCSEKPIDIGEIGCGSGTKLAEFKKQCSLNNIMANYYGCDYSSDSVELSNKKGLVVSQGGWETLGNKKFDILILSHIVEHFSNLDRELGGIKALMKQGGVVYVEVPGVCDLENKREYAYNYNIYSVLAHMYNFNLTSLRYVMESNGFIFIKGNEYVRSLFKVGPIDQYQCSRVAAAENYKNIMEHLNKAREKQMNLERKPTRMLKRLIAGFVRRFVS
jgi:SAM-dependent methyltransferase